MLVARSSRQSQLKSGSFLQDRVTSRRSTITESQFKVGYQVGFQVVSLCFRACGVFYFYMDGHPQATVVLFPCALSQGFKEATIEITVFHFICILLYGV